MTVYGCQSAMRGCDVEGNFCWMYFQAKIYVKRVKSVEDRQESPGKIIVALLQEFLICWWESVARMPNARPGKPGYHCREFQVLERLRIDEVARCSCRFDHMLGSALAHAVGVPISPDV